MTPIVAIFVSILFILYQRTEVKRRKLTRFLISVVFALLAYFGLNRTEYITEIIFGILLAFLISFLFWLVIGRYNPVGTSDEIRVITLDD